MPAARIRRVIVAAVMAIFGGACSSNATSTATSAPPSRTITITMVDIGYRPSDPISVAAGSTVRFVFTNAGKQAHEGILGDQAAQDAHDKEMRPWGPGDMSGMNMNGPGEITVQAGKTGELTYTFRTRGQLFLGCHYPGHYAAGMHIAITVT